MELRAKALRTGVSGPGVLLRVEGAVLLVLGVHLYLLNGGSWVLFGLLFLAPDLSILGYVVGGRASTTCFTRTPCPRFWRHMAWWEGVRWLCPWL
jgi:hypothetical protein